jgi:hypothetical protein
MWWSKRTCRDEFAKMEDRRLRIQLTNNSYLSLPDRAAKSRSTKRNSYDRRFFGIYQRDGVWPSAARITNDHFGVTAGMRSLGHR